MQTNLLNNFGFEVDFLPIGDKSKSGDAICVRWGYNLNSTIERQFVMLIDGGHAISAPSIIDFIKTYYYNNSNTLKENTTINLLINTHPHSDHFGGIPQIYDETNVQQVVMHRPWTHTGLPKWFQDDRVTDNRIKTQLKEGLESAYKFSEKYKKESGNDTIELYAGRCCSLAFDVKLYVLGPSLYYYNHLLPDFNATPTSGNGIGQNRIQLTGEDVPARIGKLTDEGDTSAENLSGLIFALKMPTDDILIFTGDAGKISLSRALFQFSFFKLDLRKIVFFQVPHHGSCQNIGPTILNRLFGYPGNPIQGTPVTSYISVASEPDYAHPSRRLINALLERNCDVFKTQGDSLWFHSGIIHPRVGWTTATNLRYQTSVEG